MEANPSAQTPQWGQLGVPTIEPTKGRWQMPVLSKMGQPPPVQFQHLTTPQTNPRDHSPHRNTSSFLGSEQATAGAQQTPKHSQPRPQEGEGGRETAPSVSPRANLNEGFSQQAAQHSQREGQQSQLRLSASNSWSTTDSKQTIAAEG